MKYYFIFGSLLSSIALAAPKAPAGSGDTMPNRPGGQEMDVTIKGTFKGRVLVKKIQAPVTFNLEKIQDFPEDPSQRILLDPLPVSQNAEFNSRSEVKGHTTFFPWYPAIPEPPFLRLEAPKLSKKNLPETWVFEVLNPQGQTIFRQRGTQDMPTEFLWDGNDSEKRFAVVDRLYTCQLTLNDKNGKGTVVSGDTMILPALAYGLDNQQTVEISLGRLFALGKDTFTQEGVLLLQKLSERARERGSRKIHVRISTTQDSLAPARESAIVLALQGMLHLMPQQITHDVSRQSLRGDVAIFWLK